MINLLSNEYKQKLQKMRQMRLLVTVLFLLLMIVAIAGALLVPAYIISSLKENSLSDKLAAEKHGESFDTETAMNKTIADINKKAFMFSIPNTAPVLSADILQPVFALIPQGVAVTEMSVGTDANKQTALILSGTAGNRQALELFVKNLQTDKHFSKIDLPISNFVKDANIDYKITCTLSPE